MARGQIKLTRQADAYSNGEVGEAIRIIEAEPESIPITIGDDGTVETTVGGDGEEISGDFEQVGDVAVGTEQSAYTDPATVQQPVKKRRGRQPGTKNKPRETTAGAFVTANLEKVLFNLHIMASGLLHEPDLEISEDEAKLLANATAQVANAYGFAAVLAPKTQAAIDMGIAIVTVYGDRAMRIMHKQRKGPRIVQPINAQGT